MTLTLCKHHTKMNRAHFSGLVNEKIPKMTKQVSKKMPAKNL